MNRGMMKAAVVPEKGKLSIEEIPVPEIPEYMALCKNIYGATCTATDQHLIDGSIPVPLPTLLGHESIGRVIEVGEKVRSFKVGDRVARTLLLKSEQMNSTWGGYAEYGLVLDWQAMKEDGIDEKIWCDSLKHQVIPEDIPDEVAPMLITWRETHSCIMRMGVKPGMRVLVIGTGGNGLSFAAHARWEGASAVVVGSSGREKNALMCGAEAFVSYRDKECPDKVRALMGDGFDLLIDAVGNEETTRMLLPTLKKGGVIAVYGINEPVQLPEGDYTRYNAHYVEGETHDRVIEGVRAGMYPVEAFYDVNNPYPLDRLNEAFDMLAEKTWPKALIRL